MVAVLQQQGSQSARRRLIRHERFVFVFGSNRAGHHGRGAAVTAKRFYGAKVGVGEGRCEQSYALPTKTQDLQQCSFSEIEGSVYQFLDHARAYEFDEFMLTRVGCGLAGFSDEDLAPLFRDAPPNVWLPRRWEKILGRDDGRLRLIVAGPRDMEDKALLHERLDGWLSRYDPGEVEIVNGDCSGADTLASEYAKERGMALARFPAAFGRFGAPAGPLRNQAMAWYSDGAGVFYRDSSRGSKSMIEIGRSELERGVRAHRLSGQR